MNDRASAPQPQYGQLATPQEVAEALGLPASPDPAQRMASAAPPPPATPAVPGLAAAPALPTAAQPRRWDRFATIFMLVFGLVNLLAALPATLGLDVTLREYFASIAELPDVSFGEVTRYIGQGLVVAHAIVFTATTVASWRRLRRGKLSFWVPLVGAAMVMVITTIGTMLIALVDPAFIQSMQ